MISINLLNTIIKPKKFLITAELMIKMKLNENLVEIIMNHTNFIRIPKEKIKKNIWFNSSINKSNL